MTRFRVKLDLSQFYDDERNLAYILVDPKWDQVFCLQQHVEKLFDVSEVHFLTEDGIYIPPRESIEIIKSNDVLRAIVPKQQQSKKKKKKKSKAQSCDSFGSENGEMSLEINGDKRKCNDLTPACSTPNLRPKKKQKTSKENTYVMEQCIVKELQEETNIQALQNSNAVTSTIDSNELSVENRDERIFLHPNDVDNDTMKSRKRKRTRKNKKSKQQEEMDEKNNRLSSVPIPISSSTLRLSKSMSTPNHSTKHVHFNDDAPTLVEEHPKSNEGRVIYRSLLSIDSAPRVIEAEKDFKFASDSLFNNKDESMNQKPRIEIQETIILVPAPKNNISSDHAELNDCSVIEVDDSVARSEQDDAEEETIDECCQDISVEKILPLSEELSELPNVGDVILFKMYRLSEAFTPEISNYICGRCEQVDTTRKTMNCLVLDGLDQLDENLPRLTPSDENGIKKIPKTNSFQFHISEMLDKRIFRM